MSLALTGERIIGSGQYRSLRIEAKSGADLAFNETKKTIMEPDQLPEDMASRDASVDASRRRFTRAGIAVSGVMLTLASRPVLGTGNYSTKCCKSPSGWQSANKSATGKPPVCEGKAPTYWKDRKNSWPVDCNQEFKRHFSCNSYESSRYGDCSLYELCSLNFASDRFRSSYEYNAYVSSFNNEKLRLCSHIVAAYLNARSGFTPFLKEETIRAMFTECINGGGFSPTAGVRWTVAECIEYLAATQAAII